MYALEFPANDGAGAEYQLDIDLSGQTGTYTISVMAYVSSDYDGSEVLLHTRFYTADESNPTSDGTRRPAVR